MSESRPFSEAELISLGRHTSDEQQNLWPRGPMICRASRVREEARLEDGKVWR